MMKGLHISPGYDLRFDIETPKIRRKTALNPVNIAWYKFFPYRNVAQIGKEEKSMRKFGWKYLRN